MTQSSSNSLVKSTIVIVLAIITSLILVGMIAYTHCEDAESYFKNINNAPIAVTTSRN